MNVRLIDQIQSMPCYGAAVLDRTSLTLRELQKLSRHELYKYRELLEQWREDPSGGYGKRVRAEFDECGIAIVADEAAAWFFEHADTKDIGYKDVPNATPPFEKFWVEAKTPIALVGAWVESIDLHKRHKGNLLTTTSDPRERWALYVTAMQEIGNHGDLVVSDPITLTVDGEGRIVQCPLMDDLEYCWIGVILSALSFIHCKNVVLTPAVIPPKLDRVRQKRGNPPLVKYKVLRIGGMKDVLRREGQSGELGIKHALHICRGHFKNYTAERPLFGRIVGTVWCPQHTRGDAGRGVVVKDYAVAAGKPIPAPVETR